MAVGPRDVIDQLLVQKYTDEKVDNPQLAKMVEADKMLEAMGDFSNMHRTMMNLNTRLNQFCSDLNAKCAYYKTSRFATT